MFKLFILGHAPLPNSHPDNEKIRRQPGRWVYDQAKALSAFTTVEVTLITLVSGASCDYSEMDGRLKIIYLKSQLRHRIKSLYIRDILRIRRLISFNNPDLVHSHGTEDAYAIASIFSSSKKRILTIQGLYRDVINNEKINYRNPLYLLEKLEKFALGRFRNVIVKSVHVQNLMNRYYPEINSSVIPNTISEIFITQAGVEKKANKIAFVGSLLPRKGAHHIAEALQFVEQRCEFHVYGDTFDEDYKNSIIELIRDTPHQLILHGCVDSLELRKELANSNLLIAPSYAETFGNQVIEGMLCECHCVVTENTGMAENVKKYGNGDIVPQKNSLEIADRINSNLVITSLSLQNRKMAKEAIIADLGHEQIAHKLMTEYRKTLELE